MTLAIFDFNRTIYDPEKDELIEGARVLLEHLAQSGVCMLLISKRENGRTQTLARLGIEGFFQDVIFTDEKTSQLFSDVISKHNVTPESVYVVGDHLYSEIRAGNRAGARTIHFKHGKFAALVPQISDDHPWSTVSDLSELCLLIP